MYTSFNRRKAFHIYVKYVLTEEERIAEKGRVKRLHLWMIYRLFNPAMIRFLCCFRKLKKRSMEPNEEKMTQEPAEIAVTGPLIMKRKRKSYALLSGKKAGNIRQ